ncbi:MAG: serine/threonine-protein kinase, partial [Myxococcota bacterium]
MTAARRLGRYRVGERIGTGGVADVFLAEAAGAEGWGKSVVLKCLRPHVADIPEVVESLIEEARLAQRLQHGNIVQVFDFEVDDGVPFVVMEHVDGCTLRELTKDLARRQERIPLEAALFVVEQVAAALGYAHRLLDEEGMPLDVVHRDIKPSNILLSREGLVKLADFGIAKVADRGRETLPGVLKGTPTYWAPEQAAGDPVDARADVYGLGVVLRELVGDADAEGPAADERVDDSLHTLVDDATAAGAADRLGSMRDFVNRLRDWAADHRVRPSSEAIAALVRRAKRDKPA